LASQAAAIEIPAAGGMPCKAEARDDILGGIPTMAIAGLFLALVFGVNARAPTEAPSVQN